MHVFLSENITIEIIHIILNELEASHQQCFGHVRT